MKQKTFEDVTERDISILAEWAFQIPVPPGGVTAQNTVLKARRRGNNGHFAALKRIAEMINNRQGPWAPAKEP